MKKKKGKQFVDQIERIMQMEQILDKAEAAAENLLAAIETCHSLEDSIQKLEAYYTSAEWKQDYDDDCAGRLPEGLKRGVLSEDAVYNLLSFWELMRKVL